jgi:hypothetical protein
VAYEVGEEGAVANMATEIEHEIRKNKALSALPFHDNSKKFADPLIWWRLKKSHFPILSCLARKYLCIPATEAPSEEHAGRMVLIKKNLEWYESFLRKKASEED